MNERIPNELLAAVAIKIAVANNGGAWATHYTEEQREVWRARALDIIDDVRYALAQTGER